MRSDYWKLLVIRYKGDRKPCNCGNAYADADGSCRHGCLANQYAAELDVSEAAWNDLQNARFAKLPVTEMPD